MARPKEPRFFVTGTPDSTYERGLAWYSTLFDSQRLRCGETSPQYSHWPARPGVMDRLHATIPNCRLIYLVREPWSRIRSHYSMNLRTGKTNLEFSAYLAQTPHVLHAGCYGTQLQEMQRLFAPEQILVLESARLQNQTRDVLREVFRFLDVLQDFDCPEFDHKFHVGSERSVLSATGYRLMNTSGVQFLQRHLSPWSFYHVRQLLTKPFLRPGQPLVMMDALQRELNDRFRREVDLLRRLTGLELSSLEVKPPTFEQAHK